MTKILLGVDTGGTFTDFVCLREQALTVHKVLSTPEAPQKAILQGISDMGLQDAVTSGELVMVHGTTVATNATLEGKGVKTVYIANRGLKDILLIGRQTRQQLYNLTPVKSDSHIDPELMLEVSARLDAKGHEITGFTEGELAQLKEKVDEIQPVSIAINLLFSYLSPEHEKQIEALFAHDYFVSRSSAVLPEYREYERGITTWLNAWIGPLINQYMKSLTEEIKPAPLSIMQSSGLTINANLAADRAVNLLLSGPAGGLAAAQHIGKQIGHDRLITFDMGGTSTDVSLIEHRFKLTNAGHIAGYPVSVPMADIHTIGAGGGSIAFIDDGGLLQVGPNSAGANPGPACYGQGGNQPTVTDANLVLGRLRPDALLAGNLALNLDAAIKTMIPLAEQMTCSIEDVALGIVNLANEHMSQALRVISVQRGFDPREFTLICFGGAGGLHLCDLAESLEMNSAVVPIHAGVLSALGMLTTRPGRELVRTNQQLLVTTQTKELDDLFAKIESQACAELLKEKVTDTASVRSLDLRYQGQTYTINRVYEGNLAETEQAFHLAHEQQYGHRLTREVELVNCRLHIEATRDDIQLPKWKKVSDAKPQSAMISGTKVQILQRASFSSGETFHGPALIIEDHATTYLKSGWQLSVDEVGNMLLQRPG